MRFVFRSATLLLLLRLLGHRYLLLLEDVARLFERWLRQLSMLTAMRG
jgi:hypothetical protein